MSSLPVELRQFVVRNIDSVAQLEALLLLRANAGTLWDPSAVARRLYIQVGTAAELLRGLHERELIMLADPEKPAYKYGPNTGELVRRVEDLAVAYARQLVAITNLIHSKSNGDIQGFADAFRLRRREEE